MTSTRHPLLVLASGLIALIGLIFVATAVAAQIYLLPKFKEIVTDFGADSPLVQNIDAFQPIVSTVILVSMVIGALLCISAIGVFNRNRVSWYVALVSVWILALSSLLAVFGTLSAGDPGAAMSSFFVLLPSAAILCLLYLRQMRHVGMVIEQHRNTTALA